jgi:hypothetical protein
MVERSTSTGISLLASTYFPNIFNDETIALYQLSLSRFDLQAYLEISRRNDSRYGANRRRRGCLATFTLKKITLGQNSEMGLCCELGCWARTSECLYTTTTAGKAVCRIHNRFGREDSRSVSWRLATFDCGHVLPLVGRK